MSKAASYLTLYLRLALGVSFLSAVADRFGLWGAPGQPNVAWGNFHNFIVYAGKLNWFLPPAFHPAVAAIATVAETALGITLIIGLFTRISAILSALMLLAFALAMTVALGIKGPLDYSVFSASAGAFLLAAWPDYPLSADSLRARER